MVRRKRNKQKPALDITNRKMDHFTWTRNYSFNNFGINIMLIIIAFIIIFQYYL